MTVQLTHSVTTDHQVVLRATGELDLAQAPGLGRAVDTLVAAGARRIILDFTDLQFLDSFALGTIVPRLRALRHQGGDMVVASELDAVVRPIAASGTDAVLAVVPTVADAQGVIELQSARSRRLSAAGGTSRGRTSTGRTGSGRRSTRKAS